MTLENYAFVQKVYFFLLRNGFKYNELEKSYTNSETGKNIYVDFIISAEPHAVIHILKIHKLDISSFLAIPDAKA